MTAYMPDGREAPYIMTIDDVAEFLRISSKHKNKAVMRLRRQGLKGSQVSHHVVFRLPDVIAFMERRTESSAR